MNDDNIRKEVNMKKVIFVLLDACQYEAASRYLGFLEHMIDYGQGAKYKVLGELPSLSKPMYATLFTGLPVYKHGITCNEAGFKLPYDSVFSLCKQAGGVTAAAAYSWMSELYNHAPFNPVSDRVQLRADGSIDYGFYYWEDTYPDSHVFAEGEYLRNTCQPDFLLYHTMSVDEWGHIKGAGSAEYCNAVSTVGHLIALALPQWLQDGYQVVVTADHGMNELGIHVGTDHPQRDVPLYIFSDKVETGRFEQEYISQLNIAPMLCRMLDIPASKDMLKKLEIKFKS